MNKTIKVNFKENEQSTYFSTTNEKLQKGDYVIVESDNGDIIGKILNTFSTLDQSVFEFPLIEVNREATKEEISQWIKNLEDEKESLETAKNKAIELELELSIICAEYTLDRKKLVFNFVADNRVDFRELAKILAGIYHTRIELRQIGVRDKAKKVGGYGSCGEKLCCSRFLKEFEPVSINMAKTQSIALNPTKINGSCGRLLCCLNYENDTYNESRKKLPKKGAIITVEEGEGKVIDVDLLNEKYTIEIPGIGKLVKENFKK